MEMFAEVARLADSLAGEGRRLEKRAAISEAMTRVAQQEKVQPKQAGFACTLPGSPFPKPTRAS